MSKLEFFDNHGMGFITIVIMAILFYQFLYKRDMGDHKTSIDRVHDLLMEHINDEDSVFDKIHKSVDKLNDAVSDIKHTLITERITRAEVTTEQWNIVRVRLEETAEITFSSAILNSCMSCDETLCEYLKEFGKLVQARRIESWHIWEKAAVPTSILSIVQQVDEEMYPKVTEKYIPDIVSICHNPTYKILPKEARIELIKAKTEAVKEKVKSDWFQAIYRRIHVIDNGAK